MAAPAVAWFEVTGQDGPALQRFYGRQFDWQIQAAGDGSDYELIQGGESDIGGGIAPAQDGGSGQLTFYVEVGDPSTYLQQAEHLGSQTIALPTTLEQLDLAFAVFEDPHGHVVGLSKDVMSSPSDPTCRDVLSSSADRVRAGCLTVELEEAPDDDRNGT
jgi:predicted enzyme related to lactoylglutathione lyase